VLGCIGDVFGWVSILALHSFGYSLCSGALGTSLSPVMDNFATCPFLGIVCISCKKKVCLFCVMFFLKDVHFYYYL
jgi:hypothetical protein